jgi:putative ABC transport system permease protein
MSWSRFFHRGQWDDERARELEDYLLHEIDDNVARGMSLEEATFAAHRKLGNVTRIREEIYDMNTVRILDALWQDLRYGARLLLKNPTFAVVAVLTLALGTGANAAMFQLVNAVRLRTLPVERPQELATIRIETNDKGRTGRFMGRRPMFTEPLWRAIRSEQQAFSRLFVWGISTWNLGTHGEYRPAQGLYVSGGYFDGLGVAAHVGRVLTDADDRPGCAAPGAVLAHGFWQARYGGTPLVIGQTISLDGRPFEIIGVTPPQFFGTEVGRTFDVALPLCAEPILRGGISGFGKADVWFLDMMGRLKPEWTIERARAHFATISAGILRANVPASYNVQTTKEYLAFKFTAEPASTGVSGIRTSYATQLWVLLGVTGLVLLITCANLANLLLARAIARQREIAVRLAIGASRARIVRQMLSESFVIAALGAVFGVLIANWLSHSLVAFLNTESSQIFVDLTPDWRVFAFIASLAGVACLLFGLSPALQATATNPGRAMQASARSTTDSRERFTIRRTLVVVQVGLSLVLVVGALLFGRSLHKLLTVDPGFRQEGILSVDVDVRRSSVPEQARGATYPQIIERVVAVPGVVSAAEAFIVPMSGSGWNQTAIINGESKGITYCNRVGPAYFRTMQTTMIAGRTFGPEDRPGATQTAVVNETFVRKFLGGVNPVGHTFELDRAPGQPQVIYKIVGLVKDTKYYEMREEFMPIAYFAAAQDGEPGPFLDLVLRSNMPLASLTPSLTRAISEAAPGSTVAFQPITTYVRDSLVTERLMATLSGFFGILATLIATIGLYGVMSYMVTRRKVEIGIRMALGADPRRVVRMVIRESAVLLVAGVLTGAALAVLAARWAAALLFGLKSWDPTSFALAVVGLGFVGLVAAWIPARRAARLAPTLALREE